MTVVLKNVSYRFQQSHPVLVNVTLDVRPGEFVSIIGKSGTGKSTIFKLLTGLLTQDEGEILIENAPVSLGAVGYMPQKDLLLPWRTILQNVTIAQELQRDVTMTEDEAKKWLERVGLGDYANAFPSELSGGMRQRAAFLRALLTGKDVLLLDEPFGALDALTKKDMQTWLLSLWKDLQKTILFITHDLEEAVYLSDRIFLLHKDRSLEEFVVDLPRPRNSDMLHSPQLLAIRRQLEMKILNETI